MARAAGRASFLNPEVGYVRRCEIREWDMRDAGMSVIRSFGLLPATTIARLEAMPKKERAVAVGIMRRDDHGFSSQFGAGMRRVVDAFIEENAIPDIRIISIKNDAVFLAEVRPTVTRLWECDFVPKHRYTSFVQLSGKEFYLRPDGGADVKGLGAEVEEFHRGYMISLIANAMSASERMKEADFLAYLRRVREDYVGMELEAGYYAEMNPGLMYRIKGHGELIFGSVDPPDDMSLVDPWFNYSNFIVELIARMV